MNSNTTGKINESSHIQIDYKQLTYLFTIVYIRISYIYIREYLIVIWSLIYHIIKR